MYIYTISTYILHIERVSPSQSVPPSLSLSLPVFLSTDKLDIYEDLRMQFLSWMHMKAGELYEVEWGRSVGSVATRCKLTAVKSAIWSS